MYLSPLLSESWSHPMANIPAQSQQVTGLEGESSGVTVLQIVNDGHWEPGILPAGPKPCDFAGTKATLMPRNKKGLGSVRAREIQAVWNERRAVAVRTESRRCCSAAVSPPGLWSRPRAPQLSQNGIFLSSEHGQKGSIKKKGQGPVDTDANAGARARARADVARSYYAFINQKLVTGINLKRWRV